MPVAVNEPLSFLQRMMEYLEYAELLVAASQTDDPVHRLEVCVHRVLYVREGQLGAMPP